MIITILRKPLEGSVADNALKHGCGAINIDGTRVGTEARTYKGAGKTDKVYSESGAGMLDGRGKDMEFSVEGRWPANFILTHLDGCELRGTKKVKSGTAYQDKRAGINHVYSGNLGSNVKGKAGYADEDGKETVADWACVEGCPVIELDQQSGVSKSTGGRIGNKGGAYSHLGDTGFKDNAVKGDPGFGGEGGASRFFKQFQKDDDQ